MWRDIIHSESVDCINEISYSVFSSILQTKNARETLTVAEAAMESEGEEEEVVPAMKLQKTRERV